MPRRVAAGGDEFDAREIDVRERRANRGDFALRDLFVALRVLPVLVRDDANRNGNAADDARQRLQLFTACIREQVAVRIELQREERRRVRRDGAAPIGTSSRIGVARAAAASPNHGNAVKSGMASSCQFSALRCLPSGETVSAVKPKSLPRIQWNRQMRPFVPPARKIGCLSCSTTPVTRAPRCANFAAWPLIDQQPSSCAFFGAPHRSSSSRLRSPWPRVRTTAARARDGRVRVVATTTQAADLARQVAGDRAQVKGILAPNSDPHDYEVRPGDLKALVHADLVIRSGGDVDAWLDGAIDSAGTDAPVLTLIDAAGAEGEDPHWWQDPRRAERAVGAIGAALAKADPAGAAAYRQRADAYRRDLRSLDAAVARCVREDRRPAEARHHARRARLLRAPLRPAGDRHRDPGAHDPGAGVGRRGRRAQSRPSAPHASARSSRRAASTPSWPRPSPRRRARRSAPSFTPTRWGRRGMPPRATSVRCAAQRGRHPGELRGLGPELALGR